jgi:outer membrane protein TolC
MGAAPDTARGTPADPTPSALPDRASDLTERALQERPEVAVREAAVAREATALRLAERGYLPDFEVSVSRFRNTGASNGFGAMASMTLPLAWKSKSVTAERRRAEDLVRRDVRQAFLRAKTAGILHALSTSTHLPHADQALRTAEAAYVAGTSDLTALLDTLRTVTQVQREHVEALATLARARADLERAIGSDLPGRPTSARQEAHHD